MVTPHDAIEQLSAALKGLLTADDAEGRRILYQEDTDGERGYCQVWRDVDGHRNAVRLRVRIASCASCKGPSVRTSSVTLISAAHPVICRKRTPLECAQKCAQTPSDRHHSAPNANQV
jgi:hypothetical protein